VRSALRCGIPTPAFAGFAFSPAPRRGIPVSGSSLLGPPLPSGSPLAEVLAGPGPGNGSGSVAGSPHGRPPLPPTMQQQVHPPSSAARQGSGGGSAAVEHAIAALEAALEQGDRGAGGAAAQPPAAGETAEPAPGVAGAAAGPAASSRTSSRGAGSGDGGTEEAGPSGSESARDLRQLGGQRRRSPSVQRRRQKGMFGESYPSPWRDPRCGKSQCSLHAVRHSRCHPPRCPYIKLHNARSVSRSMPLVTCLLPSLFTLPCQSACCPVCRRLFIAASGHGSPCLDLRRVSSEVADAATGTDLGERGA